jgi:hypothetical protein
MDKKGQIAIFVILAMVLVVSIVLFFSIKRGVPEYEKVEEFNPETFIDKCIRKEVRETIDIILPQGGFVSPSDYKNYNDIKVPYLCKNINHYFPCIVQHPLYMSQVEKEIENNIQEPMENCFALFEQKLKEKNYGYSGGNINIDVTLKPGSVETVIYRDFSFSKGAVHKTFDSLETSVKSPLYDLIFVANEITSQESKNCYFSNDGFMVFYSEFDIKKYVMSDSTKIYTIKDKATEAETNIAIRGCAIPAGI